MGGAARSSDIASRQVTGTSPAIESLIYANFRPSRAVGPTYAVTSHAGYSLLTLATGAHESFVLDNRPGEAWEPMLDHVVASADGNVTAITQGGEFLALDGATVTDAQRIRDTEAWPHRTGISADGSLYFEAYTDYDDPVQHTMTVIDMATGDWRNDTQQGPGGRRPVYSHPRRIRRVGHLDLGYRGGGPDDPRPVGPRHGR